MRALVREELYAALETTPPLVEGLLSPEVQVQPHGIDLSVGAIYRLHGPGRLAFRSEDTHLPEGELVPFSDGWVHLEPGIYRVRLAERVNLPRHMFAMAWPRSSLLRMGVHVGNALWDAGYSGRGEVLLVVYNRHGVDLQERARIVQMMFFVLDRAPERGYEGRYQGEGASLP